VKEWTRALLPQTTIAGLQFTPEPLANRPLIYGH
jgi:hypothetical protein